MPQNWAETNFLSPYGNYGQGGAIPEPWWRDQLDFRRSMYRRTPDAEYPDGFLAGPTGATRSRRDDRLLDHLQNRLTQRSYQRGVHKGERIDPADYIWPTAWEPTRGLEMEARGIKNAPVQWIAERRQPNEWQMTPRGAQSLVQFVRESNSVIDPKRQQQLQRLLPGWR